VLGGAGTIRNPTGLAVSPDGMRLAIPISQGNTWLFQLPDFQQLGPRLKHTSYVTRVRFTRNGRRLMTASLDGAVRIFEEGPTDRTLDPEKRDFGRADRLEFPNTSYSHDGKWVAEYVVAEKQLRLGRVGEKSSPLPIRMPSEVPNSKEDAVPTGFRPLVKFSPSRSEFAVDSRNSVSSDRQIESWDYSGGLPRRIAEWKAPGNVKYLAFSDDGRRLAVSLHLSDRPNSSADFVSCYQVLDFPSLVPSAAPFGLDMSRLREQVVLTTNGDRIACYQQGTSVVPAWNVLTSEPLNLRVGNGVIAGLDFGSRDGRLLVSQSDRTIRQLDSRTGEKIGPTILLPEATNAAGTSVAYSPDQSRFAQSQFDKVLIFSSDHGDVLASLRKDQNNWSQNIWFGADGKRVVCNAPGTSVVWQSLLPDYSGSPDDVPSLVKLLTGLEPDPAGGFGTLAPDAIRKNVESYRKAFLAWQASNPPIVRTKNVRQLIRVEHPGRPETRNRTAAQYREIHNAGVAELQAWFNALPKTFRPSHLSVQEGSNGMRFDAIAVDDGTAVPFEAHLALSHKTTEPRTLDQDDQEMWKKGWSRIFLPSYFDSTGYRRHQIWIKVNGESTSWRMEKEFDAAVAKLKTAKKMPVSVIGYDDGLALKTAPDDGHAWELHKDLTAEQLRAMVKECKDRKWRPTMIHRHRTDANKFLLTLIDNPHDEAWEYDANLDGSDYETKLLANKARGFRPEYVHSWLVSKDAVYSVIWVRNVAKETVSELFAK
jgi:WD40 repeat protein